ncbi:hypothetical protein D3C73_1284710 [compost metagenome]
MVPLDDRSLARPDHFIFCMAAPSNAAGSLPVSKSHPCAVSGSYDHFICAEPGGQHACRTQNAAQCGRAADLCRIPDLFGSYCHQSDSDVHRAA